MISPRNSNFAVLKRLTESFKKLPGIFRELVEKEDAMMSKRDFPWMIVATDKGGKSTSVMRSAKRASSNYII